DKSKDKTWIKDKSASRPAKRAPRPEQAETASAHAVDGAQRIAKVMARAGLCSRRDAEQWIEAGRVVVNGTVLTSPAFNVKPEDKVVVDGRRLAAAERTRLFLFHKPRGYVTTDRDPEGRPTIFEAMPNGLPRVVTIGRLDINTEGLLLLTNDGGLARILELPATGWLRRYRVRAKGKTDQAQLDALRQGLTIEGIVYAGIEAKLDREQGANVWLTMGLREGKNREIKRVLEHMGLEVNRLIRLSFGPFQLGEIAEGEVEEVPTRILKDQLGPALAAEAGVDFDGPADQIEKADEEHSERIQKERRDRNRDRKIERAPKPDLEEPPRPRVDRPKPGQRKHVSVLRAEREEGAQQRRRVETTQTQDRKGRSVRIERLASVSDKPEKHTRNGRRFARQREEGEETKFKSRGSSRPSSGREDFAPRSEHGARGSSTKGPSFKTERSDSSSDRGPRNAQRAPRNERSFDGERPNRSRSNEFDQRGKFKTGEGRSSTGRTGPERSGSGRSGSFKGGSGRSGSDQGGFDKRGKGPRSTGRPATGRSPTGRTPTGRTPRKPR
ncbi:MAG: pseudouridine synthase, partial [Alphaproteobacteria bacterium]|nr:pseudouridine synthase [Alphaproteobacteria bacterium]